MRIWQKSANQKKNVKRKSKGATTETKALYGSTNGIVCVTLQFIFSQVLFVLRQRNKTVEIA